MFINLMLIFFKQLRILFGLSFALQSILTLQFPFTAIKDFLWEPLRCDFILPHSSWTAWWWEGKASSRRRRP